MHGDSAAAAAGVKVNDCIVGINGEDATMMSHTEICNTIAKANRGCPALIAITVVRPREITYTQSAISARLDPLPEDFVSLTPVQMTDLQERLKEIPTYSLPKQKQYAVRPSGPPLLHGPRMPDVQKDVNVYLKQQADEPSKYSRFAV